MLSFEYNERTDQSNKFQIACALDATFTIQYIGNDKMLNAYEIESVLSHIMDSLGLIVVKLEK